MINTLPLATVGSPRTTKSDTPALRRPRVLVVEDNHDFRDALRTVLLMREVDVTIVGNGWDAVQIAFDEPYDVVVTDVRMPKMGGLSLARSLRNRIHPPRVIVVTAFPDWEVLDDALKAGVEEVLVKPVDLLELADKVERLARNTTGALES